jgi:methylenetetrahydrofolate reductase (NADPH)
MMSSDMPLNTLYKPGRTGLSFELFPPKTSAGEKALFHHVGKLTAFSPDFVTCTYGAGGSTRGKTLDVVEQVKRQYDLPVASHLTCVRSSVDQLRSYLVDAKARGIDYIVALRGDPPQGEQEFRPVDGGLRYANELVELVRTEFPEFGVAVAGYPEKHQEAPSDEVDLINLKRKVDAGADAVITQLFYNNAHFFDFQERYERIGIEVPLVPGVLPVTNLAQIQRITTLCGAELPAEFVGQLEQNSDPEWQYQVGVDFATRQVQSLLDAGVPGIHFYVLNKSQATSAVLDAIGWK